MGIRLKTKPFMKILNWFGILVLLVVMILMLLLDYQEISFLLFIPILFNLILIAWENALERRANKDTYGYHSQNIIIILISLVAFIPTVLGVIAILAFVEQLPEHYSKENRIERRLERLAVKRFKRFKKMKAPIENGIWVERHDMQRPFDFDGIYVVPCVNGQIHGEVQMLFSDNMERLIYFNQGEIDSILFKNNGFIFSKSYRQNNNYLKVNYHQDDNRQISTDTFSIMKKEIETHFWEQ